MRAAALPHIFKSNLQTTETSQILSTLARENFGGESQTKKENQMIRKELEINKSRVNG